MHKTVSVIDTGYESFEVEKQILAEAGYELKIYPGPRRDLQAKIEFARDSEGLLIRWSQIDNQFLSQFPNLKAICRYGVGYDNINLEHSRAHHIKVANVNGYASHSVSDHTIMLLFSILRDLDGSRKQLREDYTQPGRKDSFELHQKVLGIIGLGRIGVTLARKAQSLFKEIIAYDPFISAEGFSEFGVRRVEKDELLKTADVISLHCNLTQTSYHILDEQEFLMMQKKPILINTARGGVINEIALLKALENDRLFGAGIDVFKEEPPKEDMDAIISHPKVIATGHNAWYSSEAQKDLQYRAAKNIVAMLKGELCEDLLT